MLPIQFIENYSLSIQWHLAQSERSPGQMLHYIQANRNAVLINFSTSETKEKRLSHQFLITELQAFFLLISSYKLCDCDRLSGEDDHGWR